ncbi:MAG: hypothetical protein EWM73_03509 [Nitrospira sp.]|nr:MAG: hypothetical protein EWM73_03509 [Nitrospira sp.]
MILRYRNLPRMNNHPRKVGRARKVAKNTADLQRGRVNELVEEGV